MKNLILVLLVLPSLVYGQTYKERNLDISPSSSMKVVHVTESGDDLRAFIVETVNVNPVVEQEEKYMPINLLRVVDLNAEETTNIETHVLDNQLFPKKIAKELKRGKKKYGRTDNVVNYQQVLEMYPELSNVEKLDDQNRLLPKEYYTSQLNVGAFNNKVNGFASRKLSMDYENQPTSENKKKKKGLMGKLASAGAAATKLGNKIEGKKNIYGVVDEVSHDWSDSYNGGQDKKNHWKNDAQIYCQASGKLIAVNAYHKKGDDMSPYVNREIVVFAPSGEVIKQNSINETEPWNIVASQAHYTHNAGSSSLQNMLLVMRQPTGKKFSGTKDNVLRLQSVSVDGEILYDRIVEVNGTIRGSNRADSEIQVVMNKEGTAFINGVYRNGSDNYIIESSPSGDNVYNIGVDNKVRSHSLNRFIFTDDMNYVVYNEGGFKSFDKEIDQTSAFNLHPISNGQLGDRIQLKVNESEKSIKTVFDVVHNGKDLVVQTKELTPGIYDFNKYPAAYFQQYSINNGVVTPLNNADTPLYMSEHDMDDYGKFVESNGKYYFVSVNFVENEKKKGEYLIGRRITSLKM
jgi:hypothetical protein